MATSKTAPKPKKNRHVVAKTMPDGLKYWHCSCKARNEWKEPKCVICSEPHPNTETPSQAGFSVKELWQVTDSANIEWIPIDAVYESPDNNRKTFDPDALQGLADSLKQHGMLSPLVVYPGSGGRYEVVAGERRLRAARMAHFGKVPARILDVTESEAQELRLVENIKREDLDPIEEAIGYQKLLEVAKITQGQLGERLGISQAKVSNRLRLLKLPEEWQQLIITRAITEHHARPLLPLIDKPLGLAAIYRELSSATDEDGDPIPIEEAIPSTREWAEQVNAMLKRASALVKAEQICTESESEGGGRVPYMEKNYLTPELIHAHAQELQLVEVLSSRFDQLAGTKFNWIHTRALNQDLLIKLNEEAKARQPAEVEDDQLDVEAESDAEVTEPASSELAVAPTRRNEAELQKNELRLYLRKWFCQRVTDRLDSGKVSAIPLTRLLLFALSRGVPNEQIRRAVEGFEYTLPHQPGKAKAKAEGCFPGISDGKVLPACSIALRSMLSVSWGFFSVRELALIADTAGIAFDKEWKASREFLELCDDDMLINFLGTGRDWGRSVLIDWILKNGITRKPSMVLMDLLTDNTGE